MKTLRQKNRAEIAKAKREYVCKRESEKKEKGGGGRGQDIKKDKNEND